MLNHGEVPDTHHVAYTIGIITTYRVDIQATTTLPVFRIYQFRQVANVDCIHQCTMTSCDCLFLRW